MTDEQSTNEDQGNEWGNGFPEKPDNPHEAPLSVNFRPGQAPQVTVRARTPEEWNELLEEVIQSGVFATIGRAVADLQTAGMVGADLGGRQVSSAPTPPPALQAPGQPYQGQPAWQQAGAPTPPPAPAPQGGGNGGGNKAVPKPRPTDWPGTVYKISVQRGDSSFKDYRGQNQQFFAGKIRWAGGGDFWIHQDVAGSLANWNPVPA